MARERGSAYRVDAPVDPRRAAPLRTRASIALSPEPERDADRSRVTTPCCRCGEDADPPIDRGLDAFPSYRGETRPAPGFAPRLGSRAPSTLSAAWPTFEELGLSASTLEAPRAPGLRAPDPDSGAGHPAAAGGPGRDRPGPDGHRQDRRVRPADGRVRRSRATPRFRRWCSPRRASSASRSPRRCAPTASARGSRWWPCSAARPSATRPPASRRRHVAVGHGRARDGHDRAGTTCTSTTPATSCSTRPTRCSTSASSRTSRTIMRRAPMGRQTALFSATMPAADPPPGRAVHARPGRDPGARGHAHDRHRRPLLRRGAGPREARGARQRAQGRSAPSRRSSSRAPRSASTGWRAASATPACASRRSTATCPRASATA